MVEQGGGSRYGMLPHGGKKVEKKSKKTVDNGGRVWYSNKAFREGGTEIRRDRVENRTAAEKSA